MNDVINFLTSIPLWVYVIVVAFVWGVWRELTHKKRLKTAASEIKDNIAKTFHSGFRWGYANLTEVRGLDVVFYEESKMALEDLGFSMLADVEFLHVTEADPEFRTVVRLMKHDSGDFSAAIFYIRIRGWKKWLIKLLGNRTEFKTVEFQTFLSDGRFIVTNNTDSTTALSKPREILSYSNGYNTSVNTLLRKHKDNVAQFCDATSNNCSIVPQNTIEDVMRYEEIQHDLNEKHRAALSGAITSNELKNIAPNLTDEEHDLLVEEWSKK